MSKLKIPESWAGIRLGDLGSWQSGKTPSKSNIAFWTNGSIPWVSPKDVKRFEIVTTEDLITTKAAQNSGIRIHSSGSVLIVVRSGILAHTLPVAILMVDATVNQDIKIVRPNERISSYFLAYFLRSKQSQILAECVKKGPTVQSLDMDPFVAFEMPLPPRSEQERIVAKIEATQEKVKTIESSISKAEELIEKYRESLLQKAFRGELVPQNPNDEPALKLIERIRAEKAKQSDGKKMKKDELPPIKPEEIPFEIPKSWEWVRLGDLSDAVDYGSSSKTNDDNRGVPILRMGNIQKGEIDWSNLKYLKKSHDEFPALFLRVGDLLFNRTNSPELVGKAAVFTGHNVDTSFASYLIRVTFLKNAIVPQFVSWFINSEFGRNWVEQVMVQQVGQANVNGTKLKECIIPVPPYNEQLRICKIITNSFRKQNVIKNNLESLVLGTKAISSAILASAFSGRLVRQIKADGTGHELLEKIKSEQSPAAESKTRKKISAPVKKKRAKK